MSTTHILIPWLAQTQEVPAMSTQSTPAASHCSYCQQPTVTYEHRSNGLCFHYCQYHYTLFHDRQANIWQRFKKWRLDLTYAHQEEHRSECEHCDRWEVPCRKMKRLEQRVAKWKG
jgi:hypothetical protein